MNSTKLFTYNGEESELRDGVVDMVNTNTSVISDAIKHVTELVTDMDEDITPEQVQRFPFPTNLRKLFLILGFVEPTDPGVHISCSFWKPLSPPSFGGHHSGSDSLEVGTAFNL